LQKDEENLLDTKREKNEVAKKLNGSAKNLGEKKKGQ